MPRPEEFLFPVSVERTLGDLRNLDHCVDVPRAIPQSSHRGEGACCEGFQVSEIGVMEHLDSGGSSEIQFGCISETSDLSAVNFQQRTDVVVKRFPRKETDGSGVVGQATPHHINGTGAIFSMDLVRSAGQNPANHTDVAFFWNIVDIDGIVG